MARSNGHKIELTAYDDLFQTDESRAEAKLSKIRDIPIAEIDEFPDHPFKVLLDEDMEQLVESIKRNGVMTPATVRLKEDGRYELISGHRRKKACEIAGLETLKCEVKELTRDEAIIVMVESNLQRSTILPSEKAFAYADAIILNSTVSAVTPYPYQGIEAKPANSAAKSRRLAGFFLIDSLPLPGHSEKDGRFVTRNISSHRRVGNGIRWCRVSTPVNVVEFLFGALSLLATAGQAHLND